MRAIVIPRGYAPSPTTHPNMPHPPQPAMSPEYDVASDYNDDDQQGGDNFRGFNFEDVEQPPSYHPRGTLPVIPRYDAIGPSHVLMLPAPPTYQRCPSHQPDYSLFREIFLRTQYMISSTFLCLRICLIVRYNYFLYPHFVLAFT